MRNILYKTMEGEQDKLSYYLLVDDACDGALEVYGVRVDNARGESVSIRHITPFQSRIENLLDLLTRGCVTPTTLNDVIDDWLLA